MRSRRTRIVVAAVLALVAARTAAAQAPPSPRDILGVDLGESFTSAEEALEYAERLATASPRVRLLRYGETPEGRALALLVLASEAHLGELDAILARNAELVDPSLPAVRASAIARANPAVVWLSYGVHGDESASTEAALWTAWDLATSASDALDSLVVVIDPVVNPDGRDRYVLWYRGVRGVRPNPHPEAREHAPPWPGGRTNHYLFDLNRDWTWATQPETRARLTEWTRWNPQVHVDFHEMGPTSTYFFFPATRPINAIYPDYTLRWAEYFGRQNAAEFDRRRWLYFTGETFDLLYPGYGDTWPSLVGAIGMTYEQAGSRRAGLAFERPDGSVLTLADRAEHHRVAGLTTLRAAARRKTDLLLEFAAFHRGLLEDPRDVLIVPGPRPEAARALVLTLLQQGIRVDRSTRPFRASAEPHPGFDRRQAFPIGTYRVSSVQPRGRLALTLLQPETLFDSAGTQHSYDITAWSLPYAFGVEAHTSPPVRDGAFRPLERWEPAGSSASVAPRPYGYLVPPVIEASGPLFRYLSDGGRAFALGEGVTIDDRAWPAGTVFLPDDDSAAARLAAAGFSDLAAPVQTGLTASGIDLGSDRALRLRAPRIGLVGGRGMQSTSYGAAWFLLENVLRIPFDGLGSGADIREPAEYDVLVLPDGRPSSAFRPADAERLERWVRDGGVLVASGGSARWVAEAIASVAVRRADSTDLSDAERTRRGLRTRKERESDRWEGSVTGTILPVRLDEGNPLAWGAGLGNDRGALYVLHVEDLAFEPSDDYETVAAFEEGVDVVSGVMSERKRSEISASSWLVTRRLGRGRVILFADDPLFRLMWRSTFGLFVNALLLGPAMR
ncbi:MAG: M14 family zinc carboxypeptidase [Gemmatimonadota bacterium]